MLITEKIINYFRRKGFDDFYLADTASEHDTNVLGIVSVLTTIVVLWIIGSILYPLAQLFGFKFYNMWITWSGGTAVFMLILSSMGQGLVKQWGDTGEGDMRTTYFMGSFFSLISEKLLKYGVFTIGFLFILVMYGSITRHFYNLAEGMIRLIISFIILAIAGRYYNMAYHKIFKEGVYYVSWLTHQKIEHFDELFSNHEKWWMPEKDYDFLKFNMDKFQKMHVIAFVSAFITVVWAVVFFISSVPLFITA